MLKWRCCHGLNYTDLRKALSSAGSFKSFASICEAYIHRLRCLDVDNSVDVVGIDQLKRLRRPVICTLDVHSVGIGFSFDEVTGLDVFENDVLHDVYLR